MAISLSSLSSSFASLSFSSNLSSNPRILRPLPTLASTRRAPLRAVVAASSAATAVAAFSGGAAEVAEVEGVSLEKYVKARLPGGFAAQRIIGTGRRKCATARVVLQEGSGKVIINYRDAKVIIILIFYLQFNLNIMMIYTLYDIELER